MNVNDAINAIKTWEGGIRKTTKGNVFAEEYIKAAWTLATHQMKYEWHDLRKNPEDLPAPETEVDVVCLRGNQKIRTHGFYEDGNIHSDSSVWCWDEIYDYGTYCEDTDDWIIHRGWWEYKHYNDGYNFNFVIDDTVIAWREIEPFEEDIHD